MKSLHILYIRLMIYFYFTKIRIINNFAYSFELFIRFIANFITLVITIFIWKSAYQHKNILAGVNQDQMITYSIISILLIALYNARVDRNINERIREGYIAIDFLRPISPLISWFFDDIGTSVDAFLLNLLPLLLFSILVIKIPLPHSFETFILFLSSGILSYCILWLITAITGMIAFWYLELGNMSVVRFQLIRILSGSFVPLWFFPHWMQKISAFLPFIYIYQVPLGVYIGKIGFKQALISMLIQMIWILILGILLNFIWKKACKKMIVQGG